MMKNALDDDDIDDFVDEPTFTSRTTSSSLPRQQELVAGEKEEERQRQDKMTQQMKMISTIVQECDTIRRAITCPICLCTMVPPIVTLSGCSHSFCSSCITTSYTTLSNNKDKKKNASPYRCPICALPYQRRSLQLHSVHKTSNSNTGSCSSTQEIISHTILYYKQLMQSFGMIPIHYTPTITTCTQIVSSLPSSIEEDDDENESPFDNDSFMNDGDNTNDEDDDDTDVDNSIHSDIEMNSDRDEKEKLENISNPNRNKKNNRNKSSSQVSFIDTNKELQNKKTRTTKQQRYQDIQDQYEMSKYVYEAFRYIYQFQMKNQEQPPLDNTTIIATSASPTLPQRPITQLQVQEQQQIFLSNQEQYHRMKRKLRRRCPPKRQRPVVADPMLKKQKQQRPKEQLVELSSSSSSPSLSSQQKRSSTVKDSMNRCNTKKDVIHGSESNSHTKNQSKSKSVTTSVLNTPTTTTDRMNDSSDDDTTVTNVQKNNDINSNNNTPSWTQIVQTAQSQEVVNEYTMEQQRQEEEEDEENEFQTNYDKDVIVKNYHHHNNNNNDSDDDDDDGPLFHSARMMEDPISQSTTNTKTNDNEPSIRQVDKADNNSTLLLSNQNGTTDTADMIYHRKYNVYDDDDDSIPAPSNVPPRPKQDPIKKRRTSIVEEILLQQEQLTEEDDKGESSTDNDQQETAICSTASTSRKQKGSTVTDDTTTTKHSISFPIQQELTDMSTENQPVEEDSKNHETSISMFQSTLSESSSLSQVYRLGDIVQVQARTGPGMNQLGGIAEIVHVHTENQKVGITYDVRYVLNRRQREYHLKGCYISLPEYDISKGTTKTTVNDHSNTTEASRINRTRRSCPNLPTSILPSPLRAALLADGCDVDGIATRKALSQFNNKNQPHQKSSSTCHGKENTGNVNISQDINRPKDKQPTSQDKKRKNLNKTANTSSNRRTENPSLPPETKRLKAAPLGNSEVDCDQYKSTPSSTWTISMKCQMADEMYRNRIEMAIQKGIVYISTSLLSIIEQEQLELLCRILQKDTTAKLKILDKIEPKRTTLCILPTTTSATLDGHENVIADRRSMKAMFASLEGIPMISSSWIDQCIQQKQLIIPNASMIVRTLPTKTSIPSQLTAFGVSHVASHIYHAQKYSSVTTYHPLNQVQATFIVGFDAKSNDVSNFTTLLRRSGVNEVIVNPSIVPARLKAFLNGKGVATDVRPNTSVTSVKYFVILCNNDNNKLPFSDQLIRTIQESQQQKKQRRVMVVNIQWLFDSVSCGIIMKADTTANDANHKCDTDTTGIGEEHVYCYKPVDAKAIELWQITKK